MKKNYDDIIFMEHHTSTNHPRMPIEKRAAQFAPFAALTGFEQSIRETAKNFEEAVLNKEKGIKIE